MTTEQQDKRWNDLSEQKQLVIKKLYEEYSQGDLGAEKLLEELYGSHNLNPTLTYEDVANRLFEGKTGFVINQHDVIVEFDFANCGLPLPFNATSKTQLEKLGAINKFLNVAKYLNGDWRPNWSDDECKWALGVDPDTDKVRIIKVFSCAVNMYIVYFRTEKLAEQAIKILGEETIRLTLSTDY